MRKLLASLFAGRGLLLAGALFGALPASAQNVFNTPSGPTTVGVVDMCLNGSGNAVPMSSGTCANPVQVSGTFTASLGGFTPSASGARATPLTVTTSDSSGTLPTGAVSIVSNVGSNPMYCNVNAAAATTADQLIPASSWIAFTIPSGVTVLHCIATGGSTTANALGGAGLPTGTSAGSGGGAVTANAGTNLNTSLLALETGGNLATLAGSISATVQQSNEKQINGVVPLMGNGVSGTGSQRVNVASDNSAFQVKNLGNAGGIFDFAGQNAAQPANSVLIGGEFNTTPTTITSGNASPFQLDAAGNLLVNVKAGGASGGTSATFGAAMPATGTAIGLYDGANQVRAKGDETSGLWVNIKAGAGSGGTAIADEAAFTQGTTNITPGGCLFINSYAALTTGHIGVLSCTSAGSLHTTIDNTNANGQTTMSASSPVTIASNQSAFPVNGGGTAGAANAGVMSVQGIASMTPVLVNPGTAANFGVGATGSAAPANAQLSGAVSSGNLTGLIQADSSAAISISTATTTQLVALSSTKKIYVTAWDVIAGGTGNITLEYGTGSNCGTGTTVLTGAYNLTAQAGIAKGGAIGPVLVVPASNALCALTSAAVQMSGSVAYTQF